MELNFSLYKLSKMSSSDDFFNSNSHLVNNNNEMPLPTKSVSSVIVTVNVEKPRRRASSNHHSDQLHHTIKRAAGKGYNRRAELLCYAQSLRESARSREASSTSLQSKLVSSKDQQHSNKTITVQRKQKYSKTPSCFENWGTFIPSFLRSLTTLQAKKTGKQMKNVDSTSNNSNKMKAAMKSLQMQKKWRFFSKPISMMQK